MPPGSHVHIISAGEKIHTAYPAIFRELPSISHTYVLADSRVYELSSNPEIEKHRLAVRAAVGAVKDISVSLSIAFNRKTVFSPVYPSVRTILTEIRRGHPGARFTFDLSGGSKPLSMALFAFAPWMGGEVYSAFDERTPRSIPLSDRSVRSMMANPNYQTILALLLRTNGTDTDGGTHGWVSREYIYKQLFSYYHPSRTKKAEPGNPPVPAVRIRKGWKPAAALTHGTFSTFMRSLEEAGLVRERVSENTKRQKDYQITDGGDIAFRFYSDPAANTLVRTVLEKT